MKMMNLLALSLVLTSLAGAAVWSPSPALEKFQNVNSDHDDFIVKEGHRSVVQHDKNSQSNSPEYEHGASTEQGASVLPNFGQGISENCHDGPAPRELICHAFGNSKHKIPNAIEKAKEKISRTAHNAFEMKMEGARGFVSMNKEAAREVCDGVDKVKEAISNKAHDFGEGAKNTLKKVKETATTVKDTSKTLRVDVVGNVSNQVVEKTGETTEAAKDAANKVMAGADKVSKESKRGLSEILKKGHMVANFMGLDETLNPSLSILNLLGFATGFGTCVWVTFVSNYVLSRALPRQQFGMVQSKIYPVYVRAMAYGVGMALLGHVFGQRRRIFTSKAEMLQVYNLLFSLLTVCVNSMYLKPKATRVMFERMKMEKEEGKGREGGISEPCQAEHPQAQWTEDPSKDKTDPSGTTPCQGEQEAVSSQIVRLNEKLEKLNSYSSLVNILTLMSLLWHLVHLGQQFHTCSPETK